MSKQSTRLTSTNVHLFSTALTIASLYYISPKPLSHRTISYSKECLDGTHLRDPVPKFGDPDYKSAACNLRTRLEFGHIVQSIKLFQRWVNLNNTWYDCIMDQFTYPKHSFFEYRQANKNRFDVFVAYVMLRHFLWPKVAQ